MNKIITKIILITFILASASCSYKPIFSEKNYNFQIDELNLSGDKDINKVIDRKLTMIRKSQNSDKKRFSVIINSIKNEKIILEREIEKSNIYNNKSDKFELDQNEKNIITNLSEKISDSIISSIINLNDN